MLFHHDKKGLFSREKGFTLVSVNGAGGGFWSTNRAERCWFVGRCSQKRRCRRAKSKQDEWA
ncbi:hypothetical protein GCWU000325_01341 [Alloprevotella tannerae ATCC 51259]|uniref:Uncharacterized protein n=1 Tax=Alloprevotella tannerae ATCC 51259 TaxID=626522 RepID=C9LGJ7_9BACT|nr:hypothetical protein GCWU000325_01341 [Alloprevotella tannerae ATCC 51259]